MIEFNKIKTTEKNNIKFPILDALLLSRALINSSASLSGKEINKPPDV